MNLQTMSQSCKTNSFSVYDCDGWFVCVKYVWSVSALNTFYFYYILFYFNLSTVILQY